MGFIWLILFILALLILFVILFRRIRPWWKKGLLLVAGLVTVAVTAFQVVFPMHPTIATTGEYSYAVSSEYFNYPTSNSHYQTSEGNREIPVMLWHPEQVEDMNGKLILFSHGSLGIADSNDSLFNELASHGYVVASLSHPYHSFTATLEDGSTIMVDTAYLQNVLGNQGSDDLNKTLTDLEGWSQLHEDDLSHVIQQIQDGTSENEFLQAVDSDNIILIGHSLGGTAALNLGRSRDDIVAVVALESPFSGDVTRINEDGTYEFTDEPYPLPMLNIYSDTTWDVLDDWVLYEQNLYYVSNQNEQYQNAHIVGSGHIGLTDLHRVSPLLTNVFDGGLNSADYETVLKQINEAILPFLNEL